MEVVWVALLGGCVGQPCPQTGLWCQCPGKLCGPPAWGLCGPTISPCMVQGQATTHHQEVLSCSSGPLFLVPSLCWMHRCWVGQRCNVQEPHTIKKSTLETQGPFFGAIAVHGGQPLLQSSSQHRTNNHVYHNESTMAWPSSLPKTPANIGQKTISTIRRHHWNGKAFLQKAQPEQHSKAMTKTMFV